MIRTFASRRARFASAIASISILSFGAHFARAIDTTWTGGGGDGLWSNPLNWSSGVPTSFSDDVTFPASLARTIDLGGVSRQSGLVTVSDAYTLTDGTLSSFNVSGDTPGIGTIACNIATNTEIDGMNIIGTVGGSGGLSMAGSWLRAPATHTDETAIHFDGGATFTDNGSALSTSYFFINSTLTCEYTGGSIDRMGDTSAVRMSIGGQFTLANNGATPASETVGSISLLSGMLTIATTGTGAMMLSTPEIDRQSNATGLLSIAGTGSFLVQSPPAQVGGGGGAGSTARSIVPWLFSTGGAGGALPGLTTYDNGLRALSLNEYATSISTGPSFNNVRLTSAQGVSADSTINGLVLHDGGAIAMSGGAKLTVSSGAVVLASSASSNLTSISGNGSLVAPGELIVHTDAASPDTRFAVDVPIAAGSLTKSGKSNLVLSQLNSLPGGVVINAGTLVSSASGALDVGTVQLRGGNLAIENVSQTIGGSNGLVAAGSAVDMGSSGTGFEGIDSGVRVDAGLTATINGPVSGLGGINKTGPGRLIYATNNPNFTGATLVSDGVLEVDGSLGTQSGSFGSLFVFGSGPVATLAGTTNIAGSVLTLSIEPGPANGIGSIKTDMFNDISAQHFTFDIAGSGSPGVNYDQLVYTISGGIGGAMLNINLDNFSPALNTVFTIIDDQPAFGNGSKISGTFAGLPDNSVFGVGSTFFRINYLTNGDVTLTTVVPEPGSLALLALPFIGVLGRRGRSPTRSKSSPAPDRSDCLHRA